MQQQFCAENVCPLQIVIADALHRYHKNDFHVMLNLTCNCDGNGVMGSDLKSEYLLNISLVDAFMKGQTTECQVAGRTITLDPCVYVWDADSCELLLPVVKPDFAKQLQSWLDAHCADNMQPCKIRVYGTCFQDWFFEDYLRGHDAARFVFGGQPLPRLLGAGSFLQHLGINK